MPKRTTEEMLHGVITEMKEQNKRLQMLLCELLRENHTLRLKAAQHSQ
jgi:hypothetical protein